jgi:uncharacterized protein YndB with AHSA1/START domain/DNA-binding transcriptional ArsR family regulator
MQVFTCIISRVADFSDVFKALADPTRRQLLDRLRERNGQTLSELCDPLAMARQSATQHLGVLEGANLVTTARRGREKFHYLNPVPLWAIQERWIGRFERPRLQALSAIKHRAEEDTTMADRPSYVYVTYIESSAERVWEALTDADLTAQYWGHSNVSDWHVGSPWKHERLDGSGIADVIGTVLTSEPPHRLSMTFDAPGDMSAEGSTVVTFEIDPYHEIVRLTVTHEGVTDGIWEAVSSGWPAVCANLKSLLETGRVLPRAPWEMHADLAAAQMARNDAAIANP